MDIGYIPTKEQLQMLAAQSLTEEIGRSSFEAICSGNIVINQSTGAIPTKNVRIIYSRRAKWNQLKHGLIQGFDQLIPVLESTTEQTINIVGIETTKSSYVFFTDSTMTKLLGTLSIPKTS